MSIEQTIYISVIFFFFFFEENERTESKKFVFPISNSLSGTENQQM